TDIFIVMTDFQVARLNIEGCRQVASCWSRGNRVLQVVVRRKPTVICNVVAVHIFVRGEGGAVELFDESSVLGLKVKRHLCLLLKNLAVFHIRLFVSTWRPFIMNTTIKVDAASLVTILFGFLFHIITIPFCTTRGIFTLIVLHGLLQGF